MQEENADQPWRRGGVKIDLLNHRMTLDGAEVALGAREFQLLALLMRNAGRVMTHRQLLTAAWGGRTRRTRHTCGSMSAICATSWHRRAQA